MITLTSSFLPNIIDELNSSNILQDRLPGDVLTLPNTYYDLKIKPNDMVTSETINYTADKLHNNWLYLMSKSIIPSNNIPNKILATDMIIDTGTGPEWRPQSSFPALSGNGTGYSLDGVIDICKIDNTANANNSNYVMATNTNIIMLSGVGTSNIDILVNPIYGSNSIIISNNNVTHPNNGIVFENIVDTIITESKELFVLDSSHNSLFKFDITGMITGDEAILYNETPGRLLIDTIGGTGSLADKTKFKNPIAMATNDNEIYIIDYDDNTTLSVLKIYDSDLNWKGTHSLGYNLSAGPVDVEFSENTGNIYVLCHSTTYNSISGHTVPELIEISNNYSKVNTHYMLSGDVNIQSIGTEKHKKIIFSKENNNIFYILTEKSLYKKYISRPEQFIGEFQFDEKNIGQPIEERDLTAIELSSHTISINGESMIKDEILLHDDSVSIIFRFVEDGNYERSTDTTIDHNSIDFTQLKLAAEDGVNAISYNRFIHKLLYNNLLFLESFSKRFTTVYDTKGLSRYIGFTYLTDKDLESAQYNLTLDNFIGVNEIVTSATLNRVIKSVYNLQLKITSMMQEKSINVYPLTDVPVVLDLS